MAGQSLPPSDFSRSSAELQWRQRRITVWTVLCPVSLVISLVSTFLTLLSSQLDSSTSDVGLAASYLVSLSIVLLPSIRVAALSISEFRKRRLGSGSLVPCLVVAALCGGVGLLTAGPPLAEALERVISTAVTRAQDPTPEETSRTPAELGAEARSFRDGTAASIPEATSIEPENTMPSERCSLSNLQPGVKYPDYRRADRYATTADADAAMSAIAAHWTAEGYSVERSPAPSEPFAVEVLRAHGGAISSASATYRAFEDENVVFIEFETICVAE